MSACDILFAPVNGAERRDVGGVQLEVANAGNARVKRVIYRPGFRWSTALKAIVGTDLCMHAHVGFLVSGKIDIRYADGSTQQLVAPQVIAVTPGHDGWVVGDEPAVVIEVDFEAETARRFGMEADRS